LRRIDPSLQDLRVGSVIPDWGGKNETFEVAILEQPPALVHTTHGRHTSGSWAMLLTPYDVQTGSATHVQLRLRLAPVKRKRLAGTVGEVFDASTIAGLAAGLRERLAEARPAPRHGNAVRSRSRSTPVAVTEAGVWSASSRP